MQAYKIAYFGEKRSNFVKIKFLMLNESFFSNQFFDQINLKIYFYFTFSHYLDTIK